SGTELAVQLRQDYYPQKVLSYSQARDTLYAIIDKRANDSLYCVYTNYAHHIDVTQDPSQYVYENGKSGGMNCEHSWPQSKGTKEGQARSDMHHLFPTRIDVNQARGNHPYGEVYDPQTTHWYYREDNLEWIPPNRVIDNYSELGQGYFEPPEFKKGDVARALFYVYVMYHDQVDHHFFEEQAQTLLRWHLQDPVDAQERRRSQHIAYYQDGKANPFVLDDTLAERLLE
ncbi:MAG: endonuclease, partial [Bacteroidota bacterium]